MRLETTGVSKFSRILVFGGRKFNRRTIIYKVLEKHKELFTEDATFISGMARGADIIGFEWARDNGYKTLSFPVMDEDWKTYGKGAGHIRNQKMLTEGKPDLAFCFPGETGTADMLERLRKHNRKFGSRKIQIIVVK